MAGVVAEGMYKGQCTGGVEVGGRGEEGNGAQTGGAGSGKTGEQWGTLTPMGNGSVPGTCTMGSPMGCQGTNGQCLWAVRMRHISRWKNKNGRKAGGRRAGMGWACPGATGHSISQAAG